ncbi:hypothetical protein ACHHYP_11692 [Achlya hypogyna]|uniref:Uncharacterized protein n=1 Tax=Achlya hypogyna TaxID=1202772 RepID=A0A1V9YIM2_ACHHY|nr:hypothetical protein ACHHYP_11692 [Achlya hypogyna]
MPDLNEETLRQLEAEFAAHQRQVQEAREAFLLKKATAAQGEKAAMHATLADLNAQVAASRVARQTLRSQLLDKKASAAAQAAKEDALRRDTWYVQRNHQLEETALRRLELDELQHQRRIMEQQADVVLAQLTAIDAEKRRRRESKAHQIEHLVAKGSILAQQLQHEALLATLVLEEPSPAKTVGQRFASACEGRLWIEQEKAIHQRHDTLRQLNANRHALQQKEEDLWHQQRELENVASNGIDFLVDIHLGGAAPTTHFDVSYPKETNATVSKDADDCDDDVLALAAKWLATGDATIAAMEREIPCPPSPPRPLSPVARTPTTLLVHRLLQDIIDAILKALPAPVDKVEVLRQRREWKATRASLRRVVRRERRQHILFCLRDELLSTVIHELLVEMWEEASNSRRAVSALLTSVLSATLCPQRPPVYVQMLVGALEELRRERLREDDEANSFVPLTRLAHTPVPPNRATSPMTTKIAPSANVQLPPLLDLKTRRIEAPSTTLTTVQLAYWKHVQLTPDSLSFKVKFSIDQVACAPSYLILTGAKGDIAIADAVTGDILRETVQPAVQNIHTAPVSSHFMTVNKEQKATLFAVTNSTGLVPVVQVSKADLVRPDYVVDDIVMAHVLPSVSLVGAPMSFVVGTSDGTLVKLNRGLGVARPLCGLALGTMEPLTTVDTTQPHRSTIALPPMSEYPRREFMHGHNAAITFIGHCDMDLVSADVSGVICYWQYTPEWFSGFGWWKPSRTVYINAPVHAGSITTDGTLLVLLVGSASPPVTLELVQLTLPALDLMPTQLQLPLLRPPLKFQLLPRLEGLPGEYAVVSFEGILFVYSLATGAAVSSTPLKENMTSICIAQDRVVGLVRGKVLSMRIRDCTPSAVVEASIRHTGVVPVSTMVRCCT